MVGDSGLAGDAPVLLHQLILALDIGVIEGDAVDRADLLALRLVVVADAFGAQVGVDHVDLLTLGDGAIRHSGSQTSQLMQSSVIFRDIGQLLPGPTGMALPGIQWANCAGLPDITPCTGDWGARAGVAAFSA